MAFPLTDVVAVVDEGVSPFEFAVVCEVFGVDRSEQGLPRFDFAVCSPQSGALRTGMGFEVVAHHRLERLASADLVVVTALGVDYQPSPELVGALHAAHGRGARLASLCSGAFALARAGLLDGREATTHWFYSDDFARQFPAVRLVPDVLYVEDDRVLTSAGTAAGIDLCLHIVRSAHGVAAANGIARRMVVPPHRDGGQAQFVQTPLRAHSAETLSPVLVWAAQHLDGDLSVETLAARASMSTRTFARRFREETGTTPHHWVLDQRVSLAQRLLEEGTEPVEVVAQRCGFGSATMLRHHFTRLRSTSPSAYRRAFRGCEPLGA